MAAIASLTLFSAVMLACGAQFVVDVVDNRARLLPVLGTLLGTGGLMGTLAVQVWL